MSVQKIILDTEKTTPIYEYPITLRQGDTSIQIPVEITDNFVTKDLSNTKLAFLSDKPDATTIEDDEQSHFKIGADKKSFTYTFPDELTDASGSTTNTYFKIGNDSTSNFYIHILTKAGMEKLESGDYISKVDRIFNHVMSDYSAINDLAETGAATCKATIDKMNSDYVGFINSKNTEFKAYLATLDKQAADVKNKYNALKTQLDALEVPEIGGTNLLVTTGAEKDTMISPEGNIETYSGCSLMEDFISVVSGENLIFQRWGTQVVEGQLPDDLFRYAYYDSNRNLIKRSTAGYERITRDTVPSNAFWMRVSYPSSLLVQLERGTVPTDWKPSPEDSITGVNLLKDTQLFINTTKKEFTKIPWNGSFLVKMDNPTDATDHDFINTYMTTEATNEWYTASFWAKSEAEGDKMGCYFYSPSTTLSAETNQGLKKEVPDGYDGKILITLSTELKRYWIRWKSIPNSSDKKEIVLGRVNKSLGNKGGIYLGEPMFNEGRFPKLYRPNFRDYQMQKITADDGSAGIVVSTDVDLRQAIVDTPRGFHSIWAYSAAKNSPIGEPLRGFINVTNKADSIGHFGSGILISSFNNVPYAVTVNNDNANDVKFDKLIREKDLIGKTIAGKDSAGKDISIKITGIS